MFLWNIAVTSLAEVWIEIPPDKLSTNVNPVTSLAEVWIEITAPTAPVFFNSCVTSLAEVWIEITLLRGWRNDERCHFPRGSVD